MTYKIVKTDYNQREYKLFIFRKNIDKRLLNRSVIKRSSSKQRSNVSPSLFEANHIPSH